MIISVFDRVGNIVGKGENAGFMPNLHSWHLISILKEYWTCDKVRVDTKKSFDRTGNV